MELLILIIIAAVIAIPLSVMHLTEVCEPSEVMVFSGIRGGYEVYHSGRKLRKPPVQRVDRLDVTNMVIELHVTNAY